jgi:ferrochelatase
MKTAVVLFNLGGPSSLESVQPFLFNLFHDPAIISLPQPLRWLLAKVISARRAPIAREIYTVMGGASPLLANTLAQAEGLEALLGPAYKTFVVMRYWHPRADAQLAALQTWGPDQILLVPLYPQYSTTTTGSSIREWQRLARRRIAAPSYEICCWPVLPGFVSAVVDGIAAARARLPGGIPYRVLFSAHGLPKKVVAAGDPYQNQVERSVTAVVAALGIAGLDYQVCYQSRVGPLEWLGPSTDAEIERAGADGTAVIVVPIAFVSEHSETLVELDHEYAALAQRSGVPAYERVPTAGIHAGFLADLAALIKRRSTTPVACASAEENWSCPAAFTRCGAR